MRPFALSLGSCILIAIAAPVAAQDALPAAPASEAVPEDLSAVQAPWGRPDVDVSHQDRLYASDADGDGVCSVDPAGDRAIGCLPTAGRRPATDDATDGSAHLAATRDGRLLAIAEHGEADVSILSTASDAVVRKLPLSAPPTGLAFTPDSRELWIALAEEDAIDVVDLRTLESTGRIRLTGRPAAIVFSQDGRHAFVALRGRPEIPVLDVRSRTVVGSAGVVGVAGRGLAVTPDGTTVWAFSRTGRIDAFRTKSPFRVVGTTRVDGGVAGLAFAHLPGRTLAYLPSAGSPDVRVLDVDDVKEVARIPLEAPGSGVAQSGDGKAVFVALPAAGGIARIDTGVDRVADVVPIGIPPGEVIYVPGAARGSRRSAIATAGG